ncbi:hypothetical protein [Gilvimarinus xylanilyticus]|uniref:Uncharacterized protein n=1 Tax=Gilvimarinus xylanilyticus TaxID=2944139 RepID=A0A9X2I499_9GAMM|nr:hypothetical protein [Gilvimarinus xylanilyticus]MCP8899721.1 hypothetical protein [Gilvimarinus xylanilyticus]
MNKILYGLVLVPALAVGQDDNLQSNITGNQEQPQVLYIVPWQTLDSPTLKYDVVRDQSAAVYQHLERSELTRELKLLDDVEAPSENTEVKSPAQSQTELEN